MNEKDKSKKDEPIILDTRYGRMRIAAMPIYESQSGSTYIQIFDMENEKWADPDYIFLRDKVREIEAERDGS